MKRRVITTLLLMLTSFSVINSIYFSIKPVSASSSITLPGLTVPPGSVVRYNDTEIIMTGNIIVKENAILILKNTTIKFYQTKDNQYGAIIQGQLEATDFSEIIPDLSKTYDFTVTIEGQGSALLTDFNLMGDSRKRKECNLIVKDNAKLVGVNLDITEGNIIGQGSSSIKLSDSKIDSRTKVPLILRDSCDVSLTGFTARAYTPSLFELHDYSVLSVSNCRRPYYSITGVIKVYDSSRMIARNSSGDWHVETYHYSSAFIISEDMKTVKTFGSSTISIIKASLTELNAYNSSIVLMNIATANGLFTYENSRLTAIDSTVEYPPDATKGGTIAAYGYSNVLLLSSKARVLSTYQNSSVSMFNSTIGWMARTSSFSTLSITNSSVQSLSINDFSYSYVEKSTITLLEVSDSSRISMVDSLIKELVMCFKSVNATFAGLKPTFYGQWNSIVNGTLVATSSEYGPDITLTRTRIDQSLNLQFLGASNVTITDSEVTNLGVYNTTVVQLVNSTVSFYEIAAGAKVYVYWYLNVFALNGTSVTVSYTNGTVVAQTVVDDSRLARFTLFEKALNTSASYTMSSYMLSATWDGGSESRTLEITRSVTVDLIPKAPWWQQNLYMIILTLAISAAVIIAAVSLYMLKRKSRSKHSSL